ncbi:AraC family transcriptional regulator [Clostridium thermarum]|uniref:AraC family transcriptional regulator n=1 Tax=Clostridium thermarum TaxID=1716543 RepID=UPI00111DA2AB|nr:helix-turn-helix domain-containing protein [Clostridium thermarum]
MTFKYKRKDRVYFKMLTMTIAVIEIFIITVSGTLFFNMRNNMLKQLYEIHIEDLKKSTSDIQATINMIKSTSIQIRYDQYINLLCSYNEPDATQFIPALEQMTNYRRAVSNIDSIYVYNAERFYISDENAPNLIQNKEEFIDKSIVEIIDKHRSYETHTPIPRMIADLKTGEETIGYSFLFYDKVAVGPNSVIIINLSNQWLKRVTNQMKQLGSTKNIITDGSGRVIISDGDEEPLSILKEKYIRDIASNSINSGYVIEEVNGEKCLITYIKMPELDWNLISVTPFKVASKSISGVLVKVLLLCGFIVLVGIGAAIFLSRKLYDPVEDLLKKLSEYEIQQMDILEENKRKFLSNFIYHSKELQETFIKKGFEEYSIGLSVILPYVLILVRIDTKHVSSEDVKDFNLIKFAVTNIAKEILQGRYKTEFIYVSEDELLFIINGDIDDENYKDIIDKDIQEIQKLIYNYFKAVLSISISNKIIPYKNLQKSFEYLKEGARNEFFHDGGAIVTYEEIENRTKVKYSYPEHKGKEIVSALTTGKVEKAKELYMEVINELEKCNYSTFEIYSTFLFWEVSQGIKNIRLAESNNWVEKLEALTTEMSSVESINTFNQVVFQIFEGIAESYKTSSSSKYENIAKNVMEIIDQRYGDINLSVESVADEIGFTASYITKIFKQHTGKTVIEYINEKRIECAKALLTQTSHSVAVIAEKCGFANITYFHRAFKKVVGITPSVYRNTYK